MSKLVVIITKQAGETGLRIPGSTMLIESEKAEALELRGLVEIVKPEPKPKRKSKRSK